MANRLKKSTEPITVDEEVQEKPEKPKRKAPAKPPAEKFKTDREEKIFIVN